MHHFQIKQKNQTTTLTMELKSLVGCQFLGRLEHTCGTQAQKSISNSEFQAQDL